jgi:hypothetical protein
VLDSHVICSRRSQRYRPGNLCAPLYGRAAQLVSYHSIAHALVPCPTITAPPTCPTAIRAHLPAFFNPIMAPNITALLLAMGALFVALLAIFLEPARQFLLEKSVAYGMPMLPKFATSPVAIDVAQDIRYIGSYSADIEHFHNIFYAQDTSGKNRFAPPVPLLPSIGSVIDATQPGAWCPQALGDIFPFTSKIVNISENCLSLRVARSYATKSDAKLPVVVWIHGGELLHPIPLR